MDQSLINTLIAMLGGLFGWILRILWTSVNDLQQQDKELAEKVNSIEVLVAGDYVRRDEFQGALARLFAKLDSIEQKIDKKADK